MIRNYFKYVALALIVSAFGTEPIYAAAHTGAIGTTSTGGFGFTSTPVAPDDDEPRDDDRPTTGSSDRDDDEPHERRPTSGTPRSAPETMPTAPTPIRTFSAPRTATRPALRPVLHTVPVNAYISDVILWRVSDALTQDQILVIADRYNLVFLERLSSELLGIDIIRLRVADPLEMDQILRLLDAEIEIRAFQPEFIYLPSANENPEIQYAVAQLKLGETHQISTGVGTKIAVIDTAIDATHSEFLNANITTYSAFEGVVQSTSTHGSGIVGILVARDRLTGIAPDTNILLAEAFKDDKDGKSTGGTFSILKSIEWAHSQNAPIYNLSFSGYRDVLLEDTLRALVKTGAICIAAAGNNGIDAPPTFPAAYVDVIAVTANDSENQTYVLANRGDYIDLSAPGVDLLVPTTDQGYTIASGTSLAAAYASGAAAVLMTRYPEKSGQEIREILFATADDIGDDGVDTIFGYGKINPLRGLGFQTP